MVAVPENMRTIAFLLVHLGIRLSLAGFWRGALSSRYKNPRFRTCAEFALPLGVVLAGSEEIVNLARSMSDRSRRAEDTVVISF